MALTDTAKAAKARNDALQGALTQIEREFGKGTIMRMGDEGAQVKVAAIPTGALSLDLALGIGGIARGRIVSQPDYGEQALEVCDMLVRSGAVDVVAVDSVAALTPRTELEGQMGDTTVGLQARMMSQAMRKLAGNLNR